MSPGRPAAGAPAGAAIRGTVLNIQILRFFAALWVVLLHLLVPLVVPPPYLPHLPPWLHKLSQLGFAGVDLFFVISGAVIAHSTRALAPGAATSRHFIAVRLCRIYAGWWPFFFLYLAAHPWWGWPLAGKRLVESFLLLPVVDVLQYVVLLLWTLSMEIYFYLVVGVLLVLPRARLRWALLAWAGVVIAVVGYDLATGYYAKPRYEELTVFRMYLASPLVLEFIAGFLLCDWLRARPRVPVAPWAIAAVVFAAGGAWLHFKGGLYRAGLAEFVHGPARVALLGGMACALVACALLLRQPRARFALWLARLGDASYALYLCHILVLVSLYLVWTSLGVPASARALLWIASLALAVGFAALHYRFIEHPLYQAARRRLATMGG